jgi:phosphoribosylanthranilate isomerase
MGLAVKICGLSDPVSVEAAVDQKAAFVGFVFFARSPRAVSPGVASSLSARVPPTTKRVGVVVDADDRTIEEILSVVGLDLLQCHGTESVDRLRHIRNHFGIPLIKAVQVKEAADVIAADAFHDVVDMILFDSGAPAASDRPGGNALTFPWSLLRLVQLRRPWILAGGLHVNNLADAVGQSGARIVDVSSGVETAPGQKDAGKIEAFLRMARAL